ncbi:glycosyltransferase family 4 protein [Actinophytocola gossypii]|uniref:Glycosyltransferase family 1 protein n=1 Tax=Actinophytocola gossypii TaxID=2812003 RepID=A0ABT2JEC6_9PSEU|nr:glycosyltransferase family 1 protein [Actinophytocola gossypii]MCT2585624.1 glycosyltransferase family 1 protein [Actinophytocola gossypii]
MRVAIVTESFLPQVNGVTNSVLRVVEHLHGRGHDTLVVAPGTAGPDRYLHAPVRRVRAVDLPVISTLPIGVPSPKVHAALAEFGPDVVHLASPFVLGAAGLRSARRLGVPAVAVYQTDVAGFAAAYGLKHGARAAWRWIRRLHSAADRTLAPSLASVRALTEHGVPRVYHWARGVDTDRFAPRHADPALRAGLAPRGELLVGYVGRLAPEKQVHRLATLHGLPGVRVVVVGDGPEEPTLRRLLPDAAFLGFRTGAELAAAYASLDVFVHTGPHETFCQAAQEAMASGLPVLAPDAGGPRDLVESGRTGFLLEPHDDERFAGELRSTVSLLADRALRGRIGAAARASVRTRTWPAVCDELLGHYDQVSGALLAA